MKGNCVNCQSEFNYQPSQSGGKFCSNKCQGIFSLKLRFNENTQYNKRMGQYLKEIRGNVCEECGIDEWRGKPITCQVDHVNGNRTDNRFENLKLLCPNCHSQSDTWGIKNMSSEGRIRLIEGAKKGGFVKKNKH